MRAVVVDNKSTIKTFQKVPSIIYANDPNYIPHIKQDIEKIFDPKKNKLFRQGSAIRWVFYDDQGNLAGRIAAFVNPKTSKKEKQPTGGVGFFESTDDQALANFIFDTAKSWLETQGMEAMDGPINFGERNQFWGCLSKNFTDPNSYAMNYNPPYYVDLFENYGFKTYFEQYLYTRSTRDDVQDIFVEKTKRIVNPNVTFRNAVGVPLEKVAEDFHTVYNGAWGGHAGFQPMKLAQAQKLMQSLKPVVDKRILFFAYDGDEPIGFYINIPELNEIFKYVNGNLNWLGKLKFLYHKWKGTPRTMVGIVFGVVKKWHGRGIEGGLITYSKSVMDETDAYDKTVLTWIGDFNPKMIKVCENLGTERYREMITYRYLFDRTVPFERCPIIE